MAGQHDTKAPIWCSVDLRDGNQALIEPMDSARKMAMFRVLVQMGFREIEVGFPSASDTDFDFCRELIEGGHIPDDVTIQVLTQARDISSTRPLMRSRVPKTRSCISIIRHQRCNAVLSREDRAGVKAIATDGAKMVADRISRLDGTNLQLQYSPESFTAPSSNTRLRSVKACGCLAANAG